VFNSPDTRSPAFESSEREIPIVALRWASISGEMPNCKCTVWVRFTSKKLGWRIWKPDIGWRDPSYCSDAASRLATATANPVNVTQFTASLVWELTLSLVEYVRMLSS